MRPIQHWLKSQYLHWHINCLVLLTVLHWAASKCCYETSMYWSIWTTLRLLCTSTIRVVYAPVICHNSPAISSYGVRSIWCRFMPFTFRACSIVQPTSFHDNLHFQENGEFIPRRSSWYGDTLPLQTCPIASCSIPWPGKPSARMHWHTAGPGAYANMRFPQWAYLHRHCAKSGRTRSRSC